MAKKLLLDALIKVLGQYVELNEEILDLSVGVWSGQIVLHNLKLSKDIVDKKLFSGHNFSIYNGIIETLEITIPWTALLNSPVKIAINGVYLQVSSINKNQINKSVLLNNLKTDIQLKIDGIDKLLQELVFNSLASSISNNNDIDIDIASNILEAITKTSSSQSSSSSESNDNNLNKSNVSLSYMQQWTNTIVDNLEIVISNIHIRYNDDFHTLRSTNFSAGITLEKFAVVSCDEKWDEKFLSRNPNDLKAVMRKKVNIKNLGVYWNTTSTNYDLSGTKNMTVSDWIDMMKAGIYTEQPSKSSLSQQSTLNGFGSSTSDMQYLLALPNCLIVKLIHTDGDRNANEPKYHLSVETTHLKFSIDQRQYHQCMYTLDTFKELNFLQCHIRSKRPIFRPSWQFSFVTRQWWKYAFYVLKIKNKYIDLIIKSKLVDADTDWLDQRSKNEVQETEYIERHLSLFLIIHYRHLAAKKLKFLSESIVTTNATTKGGTPHTSRQIIQFYHPPETVSSDIWSGSNNNSLSYDFFDPAITYNYGTVVGNIDSKPAVQTPTNNAYFRWLPFLDFSAPPSTNATATNTIGEKKAKDTKNDKNIKPSLDDLKKLKTSDDVSLDTLLTIIEQNATSTKTQHTLKSDKDKKRIAFNNQILYKVNLSGGGSLAITMFNKPVLYASMASQITADVFENYHFVMNCELRNLILIDRSTPNANIRNIVCVKSKALEEINESLKNNNMQVNSISLPTTTLMSTRKSSSIGGLFPTAEELALEENKNSSVFSVNVQYTELENRDKKLNLRIQALPVQFVINKTCIQSLISIFSVPPKPKTAGSSHLKEKVDLYQVYVAQLLVTQQSSQNTLKNRLVKSTASALSSVMSTAMKNKQSSPTRTLSSPINIPQGSENDEIPTTASNDEQQSVPTMTSASTIVPDGTNTITPTTSDSSNFILEVVFEAHAPKIIIPEDCSSPRSFLLLDAGYLMLTGIFNTEGMNLQVVLSDVNAGLPFSLRHLYSLDDFSDDISSSHSSPEKRHTKTTLMSTPSTGYSKAHYRSMYLIKVSKL